MGFRPNRAFVKDRGHLGLNDVAFKQRFQLLRVAHQIQIPCVHDRGVEGQVAFVLDNPRHHLINLILALRVVADSSSNGC